MHAWKSIAATSSVVLAVAIVLALRAPVSADECPIPSSEWNEATQLTLAQVMVGEADWHEPDHIAIAFVLARRWLQYREKRGAISFRRYMQLYSAAMKVDTERARWVRSLPWGDLPGRHGESWAAVRKLVTDWGRGQVEDPCPAALHWGGTMDRPRSYWRAISCGPTKNTFYVHRALTARQIRAERHSSRLALSSSVPISSASARSTASLR